MFEITGTRNSWWNWTKHTHAYILRLLSLYRSRSIDEWMENRRRLIWFFFSSSQIIKTSNDCVVVFVVASSSYFLEYSHSYYTKPFSFFSSGFFSLSLSFSAYNRSRESDIFDFNESCNNMCAQVALCMHRRTCVWFLYFFFTHPLTCVEQNKILQLLQFYSYHLVIEII